MDPTFMKKIFLVGTLFLSSNVSYAWDVNSVVAAGSGCKASENVKVNVTGDSLEIMLPDLKTDRVKGRKLFRSNCNLSISVTGESGKQFKAVAIKTDYETSGTSKDQLSLNFKLWFQGDKKTAAIDHKIDTAKNTGFRQELSLPINADNWSACKKENVFNVGVSLIGKNQGGFSQDYSLKLAKGLKIELLWRPCN